MTALRNPARSLSMHVMLQIKAGRLVRRLLAGRMLKLGTSSPGSFTSNELRVVLYCFKNRVTGSSSLQKQTPHRAPRSAKKMRLLFLEAGQQRILLILPHILPPRTEFRVKVVRNSFPFSIRTELYERLTRL